MRRKCLAALAADGKRELEVTAPKESAEMSIFSLRVTTGKKSIAKMLLTSIAYDCGALGGSAKNQALQ
jgi:hypothetical protein